MVKHVIKTFEISKIIVKYSHLFLRQLGYARLKIDINKDIYVYHGKNEGLLIKADNKKDTYMMKIIQRVKRLK